MLISGRLKRFFSQRLGFSRSEQQFRATFEQAAAGLAHVALDGTCLLVNKRLCEMLGCAKDDLVAASLANLLHPSILAGESLSSAPESIQFPYPHKSGRRIWLNSCTSLVKDSSGQPQYWVLVLEDVTGRKAAEDQLLLSQGVIRQFASATAHELQEPLRNVALSSQLIAVELEGRSDQQLEELLFENSRSAERMQRMLKGLLTFSRAVESDPTQTLVADSEFAMARALINLQSAITKADAQVTHTALPQVAVLPRQLLCVLEHLIANAIKYRKPGQPPIVTVSARVAGPHWLFRICDNGIGFDPGHGRIIFGLFKQLTIQDEPSSTGIGLAICARIVQHYGGAIWADSKPGEGATFSFTLPGLSPEPATPLQPPTSSKWSGPPSLAHV